MTATLVDVSESVNLFDRNLGSQLTDPHKLATRKKFPRRAFSKRLVEQNNTIMSQIEEQLNSKFEKVANKTEQIKTIT